MGTPNAIVLNIGQLPDDPQWLAQQSCPVIAFGSASSARADNADVLVPDHDAALVLEQRVNRWPIAAMTLVQVLRSTQLLSAAQGLDLESLAYATLQAGTEFMAWRAENQPIAFQPQEYSEQPQEHGEPLLLNREHNRVDAILNRPASRNSMTVEMRDAWIDALQLFQHWRRTA
jgi:enoyl-CoA hydratase